MEMTGATWRDDLRCPLTPRLLDRFHPTVSSLPDGLDAGSLTWLTSHQAVTLWKRSSDRQAPRTYQKLK
eukprot:3000888-Rhodomonas_salina.2